MVQRLISRVSVLGLWPRMALTISGTFLALFVAFSLLGERAMRESNDRLLRERLVIAQMAAHQINTWLTQEQSELVQAQLVSHFDLNAPDFPEKAAALAHSFTQLNEFTPGFFFSNTQGQVVFAHPASLYAPGTDLSALPHIQQAIDQQIDTLSEPFYSPLGHPVTAVTIPLFTGNQLTGYLTGLLDMNEACVLSALEQASKFGETAHGALTDSQGRVLATTFGLPFLSPGEHHTFYRRAVAIGKPVVETVPFELDLPDEPEGHRHVMAFAPLASANWGVAVGGDAIDATFAGLHQLRLGLIIMAVLAMASAWGITLINSKQMIRPLLTLTHAAQQISRGELERPLPLLGVAEIKSMSTALEQMRLQFLDNIHQLETLNSTLEARVIGQTKDLRQQKHLIQQLLRRIINAQEEERIRLARELHDEIGQTLTAIELAMTRLNNLIPGEESPAHDQLEQVRTIAAHARTELHRVVTAMRPGVLDKLGLVPAIGWISRQTLAATNIAFTIQTQNMQNRLPRALETTLFRIAQEAVQNVAQHSSAQNLLIQISRSDREISMVLADDGKGWKNHQTGHKETKLAEQRLGLLGIQERAALVGGFVQINSEPGKGFHLQITIPHPSTTSQKEIRQPKTLNGNQTILQSKQQTRRKNHV
jgi:signal transduction histidine kinase